MRASRPLCCRVVVVVFEEEEEEEEEETVPSSAEEETSEVVVVVVVLVTVGSSTSEVQCTSSDAHNHENAMWNPVSEIGKGKPEKARMCLLKRMTEAEREIQREAAATFWRAAARAEEEEVEDE